MADAHFLRLALIHTGALAAAIGLAINGVRRRKASDRAERKLRDQLEAARESDKTTTNTKQELLRCEHCGGAVPLADAPTLACPHCAATVTMPAAYLELVRGRADVATRTREETAALRRALVLTHPLGALPLAIASVLGLVLLVHLINSSRDAPAGTASGDLGMVWIALLIAPVGMFIGAIGQLSAGSDLRAVARGFAAHAADKGLACRNCGAPIAGTADGDAAVCPYCGAQNLMAAKLVAAADRETKRAGTLGLNIAHARAAARKAVWTFVSVPCVLVGLLGSLLVGTLAIVSWIAYLG